MRKDTHPTNYRPVVFKDVSCGESFLVRSTVATDRTVTWDDGKEYPLYVIDVSNHSHPFYTGQQRLVDSEGRVAKFNRKYKKTT